MVNQQFVEIRHFVQVAELGSFTLAAQALGMTGSALSKSIARLENSLGTKLLHRTTRKVSLTNSGDSYLQDCQRALAILQQAQSRLGNEQQVPSGRVRIELPVVFGRRFILPALLHLAQQHPQLDLVITFNDRPVDLSADGIDLAIRVGQLDDSLDLVARRLGEQKRVICASPGYFERHGMPTHKKELTQHQCIVGWPLRQQRQWRLKNDDGITEAFDIPVRHEIADCEAMLAAALAGLGLVQVPLWLVSEHLTTGALVSVFDDQVAEHTPIHLIWLKTPYLQPKMRVIIDELVRLATIEGSLFQLDIAKGT